MNVLPPVQDASSRMKVSRQEQLEWRCKMGEQIVAYRFESPFDPLGAPLFYIVSSYILPLMFFESSMFLCEIWN